MSSSSSPAWYLDETSLLGEVKRARRGAGAVPLIDGYADFVEIRRGGQGVVFAATQASTHRRVAVKVLLDGGLASAAARRRFEREIDLVANLRHPGIVRVYDSGVTRDGHPYCVMEFVEGAALDEWALRGEQRPGARTVVALLGEVCAAVHFAHQRGVIHRDLKPSNIRVSDGLRAHVLDFGLAKSVEAPPPASRVGEASGAAAVTRMDVLPTQVSTTGQFVGSLPWASPEQARGEALDVRTDVYSLGVLLYQMLTGRFPYDLSGSLSSALGAIQSAPAAPPRLHAPWMDHDLSTIVLRALTKEPERRYQSAADLGDDLRRWLAGEAIAARRDSTWYVLRKLVGRHKAFSILAGAALVLLVSFGAVMAVLYARTHAAEQRLAVALEETTRQRDKAEGEARQRAAFGDFLTGMLSAASPERDGRDVKVIEVVDRAAERLTRTPPEDPLVEAAVRQALGSTYAGLGRWEAGLAQVRASADLRRRVLGARDLDAISPLLTAPSLLAELGRLEEAESLARETLQRLEVPGAQGGEGAGADATAESRRQTMLASAKATLGQILMARGQPVSAEPLLREALALQERHEQGSAAAREGLTSTLSDLGVTLRALGRPGEAEGYLRRALARLSAAGAGDTLSVLQLENNLALAVADQSRGREAIDLYVAALPRMDAALGASHPVSLVARSNLATLYLDVDELPKAEVLLREALEAETSARSAETPTALTIRNNLAKMLQDAGRLAEAEALFRETLDARTRVLGPDHAHTLITAGNLATVLASEGKTDDAVAMSRRVLEAYQRTQGEASAAAVIERNNIGQTLVKAGRPAEGLEYLQRAAELAPRAFSPGHINVAHLRANLGKCLLLLDRAEEAREPLRLAFEAGAAVWSTGDPRLVKFASLYAEALERSGARTEAEAVRAAASGGAGQAGDGGNMGRTR